MTLTLALGLVLAAAAGVALVKSFDDMSAQRERQVVANGIQGRMSEVAKMVVPQAVWDDAVRMLDNDYDPAWAAENIGTFLYQTNGFEYAFVLNDRNIPVFASKHGKPTNIAVYEDFLHEARPLIERVRQKEAAMRGQDLIRAGSQMLGREIQSTDIGDVGKKVYIFTATLVQPDFGKVRPVKQHSAIVITAMPIDARFAAGLSKRYLLEDIRFDIGPAKVASNRVGVALKGRVHGDETLATISWKPQHPGWDLLMTFGPPTLLAMLAGAAAIIGLIRQGSRMTEGLIASEARATHLAYYDPLTGHPNRVLFFDRLGQAINQLRRNDKAVAVHALDLDRFKEINDTFGHQVGDELIFEAAKRMATICRATETFARLSGDEFAIVQPNATAAGAARLASRLCEAMVQPFDLASGRVYVGCSIGITIITEPEIEPGEALRQADLALYRTKESARGQYSFFEMDMDAAVRLRRELETDLREALNNDVLYLDYQPQVGANGVMTGVEALIRWNHPVRGPISPAYFVPIAEQSGLIMQLGMFALRRAFEDSIRWKRLKIAINVSATQIRNKDFVDNVRALVRELKVNPEQFELEITEGILLGDDPETQERLARLRAMGFSLALDDFGTGYSSLSYLQRYPIDKIKIDRSFISNLGIEDEADALVGAIVKLARALKLSVIAEGVETKDQLDHLSSLGCANVQGYLFSRPINADGIDQMYQMNEAQPVKH